ncbi:MAG: AAA family ATPase [Bacilli bacterium]|nr:AAA family ATPase [Bacilli bacterium]
MAEQKKGRSTIYVPLQDVLMVFFAGVALLFLIIILLCFLHKFKTMPEDSTDLINLENTFTSYMFLGGIFAMFLFLLCVLFRCVARLNNPDVISVTLEYVDSHGKLVSATKVMDKKNEDEKKSKLRRFQKLSQLDELYPKKQRVVTTPGLTLEYICRRFRSYASRIEGNPLYYSIQDIRRFITSLGCTKILILQGMSGTGKTSLPVAWGRFTGVQTTVIPVQPMWKERSDLIGYYNEFTGKFNESMLLEKLYEANKTNKMFLIVLDEMNIARVEYYFAEFLSLLELPTVKERILEVTTIVSKRDPKELKNGNLILPNNVTFIGTANNDDSTFAISDKVYDRSMIMNLDYRCEPFVGEDDFEPITISQDVFTELVNKAKREYALTKRGRNRIKEFDNFLTKNFSVTFGNRIRRQIEQYVPIYIACGGTETEALDDLLAKKVLRKLEATNPLVLKTKSEELIAKINEIFGQDEMPVCIATIQKLIMNV